MLLLIIKNEKCKKVKNTYIYKHGFFIDREVKKILSEERKTYLMTALDVTE